MRREIFVPEEVEEMLELYLTITNYAIDKPKDINKKRKIVKKMLRKLKDGKFSKYMKSDYDKEWE